MSKFDWERTSWISVPEIRFIQHVSHCKKCKSVGGIKASDREHLCPEGQERDRLWEMASRQEAM